MTKANFGALDVELFQVDKLMDVATQILSLEPIEITGIKGSNE